MTTDEMIALFRAGAEVGSVNWQIADRIETLNTELRRQVELTDEQRDVYEAALNTMEAERAALALQVQRARDEEREAIARAVATWRNATPMTGEECAAAIRELTAHCVLTMARAGVM